MRFSRIIGFPRIIGVSLALSSAPAFAAPPDPAARGLLAQGADAAKSDVARGLKIFEDGASQYATVPQFNYNAGVLYERQGRYDDAVKAYKKAIAVDAKFLAPVENLANLSVRRQDLAGAEAILLEAIKRAPGDLNLRNRLIAVWLAGGKADAAENEAKKILKADEKNVGALVNLATVFFRRNQHELATSVLNRAKDIDAADPSIYINLGFVFLRQKDSAKAIEAFQKATELRGDLPEAHNNLGALFVEAHDYEAAIVSLQKALSLYPTFPNALVNLGNAYKGNKQYKEAEATYKKAQELDPANSEVLFNLGVLHLDNQIEGTANRFDVAREYLNKYLSSAKGLSAEEKTRAESYLVEVDRAKKREEQRLKNEERKAKMKAKEDAKKPADAPKPADPAPGDAKPAPAPEPGGKPKTGATQGVPSTGPAFGSLARLLSTAVRPGSSS